MQKFKTERWSVKRICKTTVKDKYTSWQGNEGDKKKDAIGKGIYEKNDSLTG